jgi:hypothetical protein
MEQLIPAPSPACAAKIDEGEAVDTWQPKNISGLKITVNKASTMDRSYTVSWVTSDGVAHEEVGLAGVGPLIQRFTTL